MSIESEIFKRFTPDFKRLLSYGFKKDKTGYKIDKFFLNNEFRASVFVSVAGEVSGVVYDVQNDDEFLPLRVIGNEGAFVASVRDEYEKLLTDIRNNCFSQNFFITSQGNRISDIIYKTYGDKPVFMWEEYPTFGVFKNPKSGKWYGLIMYIQRSKLGVKSQESAEVINLKLDKDEIPELLKEVGIYPAYHMNKKYWVSVILDETLSDDKIAKLIEESHGYTVKRKK